MRKLLSFLCFLASLQLWGQQGYVKNLGQWRDPFEFVLRDGANSIYLGSDSIIFSLLAPESREFSEESHVHHYGERLTFLNFSLSFKGGRTLDWEGEDPYEHYYNFFLGNRSLWRSKVPTYRSLRAREVYPGIDLVFYHGPSGIKYDWEVHPGADPTVIQVKFGGVDKVVAARKALKMFFGEHLLKEELPRAYAGNRDVTAQYKVVGPTEIGYVLGEFETEEKLVIDPTYVFSTYSGSTADNFGYSATFDDHGNAFGAGISFGMGYPTTLGAFDIDFNGGMFDVTVSKFSPDGSQLLWSSYLGGDELDQPHSIECDEWGNLYIMGSTGSDNFPTTVNAVDTSFKGGPMTQVEYYTFINGSDMFVAALDSSGSQLIGSTYLGSDGMDGVNTKLGHNYGDSFRGEIEVQRGGGPVFIVSATDSAGYPISTGQTPHQGGQDAVISVLSRNLETVLASTYVGSLGDEAIYSLSISEKNGSPTNSTRIFVAGGIQSAAGKLNASGDSLVVNAGMTTDKDAMLAAFYFDGATNDLSLLGANVETGMGYNQHFFVECNFLGDTSTLVTVVGQSKTGLWPSDTSFWQQIGSAQYFKEYKLDTSFGGFNTMRTTVFGDGSNATTDLSPTAMMIDFCGNVYFSGWGGNPNFEGTTDGLAITPNALQSTTDGRDFYFLVLDPSWKKAKLATYFGGPGREHVDGGTSRFDSKGRIFQAVCAGCGGNSDYPTFPANVYSSTNNSSNCNLAVTVIDLDVQQANASVSAPVELCFPYALELSDSSENVDLWSMFWGDGTSALNLDSLANHMYASPGTYAVTLIGQDTACNTFDTTALSVEILPPYDSVYLDLTYDPCNTDAMLNPLFAEVRLMKDSTLATDYQMDWLYTTATGTGYLGQGAQFSNPLGKGGENILSVSVYDPVCGITQNLVVTVRFEPPISGWIELGIPPCVSTEPAVFTAFTNADITSWYVNGDSIGPAWPLEIDQSGTYEISFVMGSSVCNTWDTITFNSTIVGGDTSVAVANVITPNGDNVNDRWQLIGSTTWDEFHIILYNRWGLKVFETTSPTFSWGADYDGKILSPGVYFYQVEARNNCSDIKQEGALHITY